MPKTFRFLSNFFVLSFLILTSFVLIKAQVPLPPRPTIRGDVNLNSFSPDRNKVPGATVRGRVVYEDSGLPVRYAPITLVKADGNSYYSSTYVKTDENGEFVLEDVQAGEYFPYIKNDGVLNPDSYAKLNQFDKDSVKPADIFPKISVNGLGEFQTFIRAKRGGSITGVVRYFDNEVAVGVKVEVLRKLGDKFLAYSVGNATTDDRGFYRFAGLPEGVYTVRVIEPVSHENKPSYYYSGYDSSGKNLLKTYFPNAETAKDARSFELFLGQEQSSIDITLPERRLFDVSGKIILKKTGEPLKNFNVRFYPITETPDEGLSYGNGGGVGMGDGSGYSGNDDDIPSEWTLQNIPKGKYRIVASQAYIYGEKAKDQPKYPDVSKEIEITDSNIENLIIEVPLGSSIKGTVVAENGEALPDYIRVIATNLETKETQISNYDYSKPNPEKPVKQKTFIIEKIIAGKIKLNYSGRDFYVRSISVGNKIIGEEGFELQDGENIENVRIVLASDMGTLKGKINNSPNNLRAGILLLKKDVDLETPNSDSFFGNAKPDGTYEVKAKPGEYSVIIFTERNVINSREAYLEFIRNALENAPTVLIKAKEISNLDLNLPN